jgi:hypothetical protein
MYLATLTVQRKRMSAQRTHLQRCRSTEACLLGISKTSDYPSNPRADIAVRLADVVVRGGGVKA